MVNSAGNVIMQMLMANFMLEVGKRASTPAPPDCSNNSTICYDIYGVREEFSMEPPWANTPIRPDFKPPESPAEVGTQMWLFSKLNQSKPYVIDMDNISSLYEAPFHPAGELKILVHGYKSSGDASWCPLMKDEFLRLSEGSNVVVIDWSRGAKAPYAQAVSNLRLVARQLAHFVDAVQNAFDFTSQQIHVIGHSLGAHLSGIAGVYLKENYGKLLGRISGLDPASPLHSFNDTETRLSTDAALFVDVIHSDNTSILGLPITVGMMEPIGNLDFYPNGGGNQPGCAQDDLKCPHVRAVMYFTDSLRQECPFVAVRCPSYQQFLDGECWNCTEVGRCARMGLQATLPADQGASGQYYLLTRDRSPFCSYQYRVSILVQNTSAALDHDGEYGILVLKMEGTVGAADAIRLSDRTVYYRAGTWYRYVVLAPEVGQLTKVKITFLYPGHFMNPMSWRMSQPTLHLERINIEKLNSDDLTQFCFDTEEQKNGLEYVLTRKNYC